MDWKTYGPARCTDAAMLTIHIHSRWSRHHQTNGTDYLRADRNRQCAAETQGITNRPLVDVVINKPSIVTNDTRPAISYENVNDLARSERLYWNPRCQNARAPVCLSYLISISTRNATNWKPVRTKRMYAGFKGEEKKQQQKVE
jgi:hypothetical protein